MWQGGEGLGRECVTYSLVHLRILHSSADLDLCGRGDMLCVCGELLLSVGHDVRSGPRIRPLVPVSPPQPVEGVLDGADGVL